MIVFGRATCNNLAEALSREWLETNGIGGFSSSTVAGANTRRYHGLLTAATHPPVGRVVLLSKLDEVLTVNGIRYELACNEYPGVVYPEGYKCLKEFRMAPFPVFTYDLGGFLLEKTVFLVSGENTVVVQYDLQNPAGIDISDCMLELRPLIAFRDYHSLTHKNDALNEAVPLSQNLVTCKPYPDQPSLYFAHNAESVDTRGTWYLNFEYCQERDRGLDFREDLFQPFTLRFDLAQQPIRAVIASTEPHDILDAPSLRQLELERRQSVVEAFHFENSFIQQLVRAADQFIVQRSQFQTVIAGYHWFTDWGRDTMIAFHGLALSTRRFGLARNILRAFAERVDQGMLPNRFSDAGEAAEYNTVDATLWFFEAIRAFSEISGDFAFVQQQLFPVLADIIEWHRRGTRFGIHVDQDGLLAAGEEGSQLTWMDAKVGNHVITPRKGKPVEIQALWYNALRSMEQFARLFEQPELSAQYGSIADQAQVSFDRLFWNETSHCLYDVVDGDFRDGAIRPNQVFAVSLPYPIVHDPEKARAVVDVVERELLTRYGLRTLTPGDPMYRGQCAGGPEARDSAYHQGTVWPWLFGAFVRAYLKVHRNTPAAVGQAKLWLAGFERHLQEAGLGQISEISDGDAPHRPRGCIAQAWSVAELLRTAVELADLVGA